MFKAESLSAVFPHSSTFLGVYFVIHINILIWEKNAMQSFNCIGAKQWIASCTESRWSRYTPVDVCMYGLLVLWGECKKTKKHINLQCVHDYFIVQVFRDFIETWGDQLMFCLLPWILCRFLVFSLFFATLFWFWLSTNFSVKDNLSK